jgi:hypothetical protein
MPRMISGSVGIGPQSLTFQCDDRAEIVACTIMDHALDDLIGFYNIDVETEEGMDELVARIERIVHDKIKANRLEPNGEIVIRSIDVLRFGANPNGREEAHGPDENP